MARPTKQGLDYFPFDVGFFEDEKIEAISGEFGIKGEIAVIKLLCAIYRNGYFILWSDILKMKIVKSLPGVSIELLDAIIKRLVAYEFFDKNLFDSTKILTSKGVQKRFFEATKRRSINEDFPYLLVNVCNNGVNVYNNPTATELMYTKTTQSKVKERKEEISNTPNGVSDTKKVELSLADDPSCRVDLEKYPNDLEKEEKKVPPKKEEKMQVIDFVKFVSYFNNTTAGAFGSLRLPLSEQRKKMLRARAKEHGSNAIVEVISKCVSSDFLRGQSSKGFLATFDWIIKPTNFEKILTGNYDNNRNSKDNNHSSAAGESGKDLANAIADGINRARTRQEWE